MANALFERFFWNLYARVYDTLLVLKPYRKMLDGVADSLGLPAGAAVLDAGCGTGNLTCALHRRGYSVTALDFSTTMLGRARSKLDRVEFLRGDLCRELPFASHSFDAVTSSNVLYTLPDPGFALAEFCRILRPGGRLVLTNPVPQCRAEAVLEQDWKEANLLGRLRLLAVSPAILALIVFNRILLTPERRASFYTPSAEQLTAKLEAAGFQVERLSPVYSEQSWMVLAQRPG